MSRPNLFCRPFILAGLCVFGLGLSTAAQDKNQTYQVGVSSIDITPKYPVRLNGFGSRRAEAEGVSQELKAKALAISLGDEPPLVLFAIDSLGVRQSMVDQVATALFDKYRIPRDHVALTFTHTHCAPKVNGSSDTIFSSPIPPEHQVHIDRYSEELPKWLLQVACQAIENRQPASLEWNVGKVTFAANRRTPGGPVDHDLPVLVARNLDGKPFAIYTSYACHCVTLSFNFYSGDWAGYAQKSIEENFPGSIALVSIGCGSDSNPTSGVTGDRVDAAKDQGKQIGDELKSLVGQPGRPLFGPLSARLESIDLPLNDLPTRAELEALVQQGGAHGYNASWQIAKLDRGESLTVKLDYPIQSFTFGDQLHMVFLAGEVCVDYSLRLKKELNRDHIWVNGYSNDFCAYIPSERLLQEGGYGGGGEVPYFALPTTLEAGLEQTIIDAVERQTPKVFHLPPGTQGVPPKSPEESLTLMTTHEDLRVELVAAEPLVADPVAIDFGSDGRLWVAEMPDYSRGVNETFEQHGQIRFLVDSNRDGRFDQSTVFLEGLRFPTDVKVWRDGVLVCDAPDIIFAADRDGDGKADVRQVIFSGFATHNPHARVNSLRFGLDGWVYGSGGLFGGLINSPAAHRQLDVDTNNRDFRCKPDEPRMESATGQTQQGRTRDDFGNWFGCTNSSLLLHYPLLEEYASRAPQIAPPNSIESVPSDAHGQILYPPANLVLFKLTGAPGRPTSACGAEIYRDHQLGDEFYGDAFICEPVNQLVHRMKLHRDEQGKIVGDRAENERQKEFLTSSDPWFRPVQARTGTDGALYIVDMYRYVIEHPQWIPEETKAQLNVMAGQGLGRIYRVTHRQRPVGALPKLNQKSNVEIANEMSSTNGPLRDLVQQELEWRKSDEPAVDEALIQVVHNATWSASRVQALATLAARGNLSRQMLFAELKRADRAALPILFRMGECFYGRDNNPVSLEQMTELSFPEVNAQIAFSSAALPATAKLQTLGALIRNADSLWLEYAVLTALKPQEVSEFWNRAKISSTTLSQGFCRSLVTLAASDQEAGLNLAELLLTEDELDPPTRWQLLSTWLQADQDFQTPGIARLVEKFHGQAKRASTAMADTNSEDKTRIAALELLVGLNATEVGVLKRSLSPEEMKALSNLLSIQFSPEVQSAAVHALSKLTPSGQPPLFLGQWEMATPRLRGEMIDRLLTRQEWVPFLLNSLIENRIRPSDLNASQRERLMTQDDRQLIALTEKAFSSLDSGTREEVLNRWQDSLQLVGSAEQGRATFSKHCAACHLLDGMGHAVGPDLAALTNRTPISIFFAVLDPNRDVDSRYLNFVATTRDGQTLSGLLAEETATSVTLKEREGKTHVLLRREIEELKSGSKSAMPEGIEKDFSHQELADVIAYLVPPRVPPRTFVGNQPEVVKENEEGQIVLLATQAEIYGVQIVFETDSPFKNIGYWSGEQDRAAWKFECHDAGKFDVYLDYACNFDSAGNSFAIHAARSLVTGTVESTGAWSKYRLQKVGQFEMTAGQNYLSVGFAGPKRSSSLFDLRQIILVPEGKAVSKSPGEPKSK